MNPLSDSTISWLLEADNPGVRYLTQRDLLNLSENDPELIKARTLAHRQGPIPVILGAMNPDGWWVEPGPGYNPKYRSTVWAIILLSQLGASIDMDDRIQSGCQYVLDHALTDSGIFTA